MEKTGGNSGYYSTNERILKMMKNGHNAKAIYSPCQILKLGQKINLKLSKTCEKRFYKHSKVILCKKRRLKTANTRKMRAFSK